MCSPVLIIGARVFSAFHDDSIQPTLWYLRGLGRQCGLTMTFCFFFRFFLLFSVFFLLLLLLFLFNLKKTVIFIRSSVVSFFSLLFNMLIWIGKKYVGLVCALGAHYAIIIYYVTQYPYFICIICGFWTWPDFNGFYVHLQKWHLFLSLAQHSARADWNAIHISKHIKCQW